MNARQLQAYADLKALWRAACEFDDISADGKFVVFSEDNPFAAQYNAAACLVVGGEPCCG